MAPKLEKNGIVFTSHEDAFMKGFMEGADCFSNLPEKQADGSDWTEEAVLEYVTTKAKDSFLVKTRVFSKEEQRSFDIYEATLTMAGKDLTQAEKIREFDNMMRELSKKSIEAAK